MINTKQTEMIECLYKSEGYVTAENISKVLGISTRTVKRHIDVINEELKNQQIEIISIRGTGYQIKGSKNQIKELIRGNNVQENSEDRICQMILVLAEAESITAEEIARQINYSASTINKLTTALKEVLKKYDLELLSRPYYGMSIEGKEDNIRSLLIDYGFHIKNSELNVELLNISKHEFRLMYQILLDYLKKNNIVIADRDIHSLLARITVSISRCKQKRHIQNVSLPENIRQCNLDVIYSILNKISEEVSVELTEKEYVYVSIYSGFIIYNYNIGPIDVEKEIHKFVIDVLNEISMVTGINFAEQEHIVNSLSTHLHILLKRINQNTEIKNPILQQIKSECAMEMNYAIFLAKKMEETFHVKMSEDELGYLAMYFGAAKKKKNNKKRVVILCHYGVGTSQLIGEQIRQEFSELEVIGIYPIHYIELAEAQEIDLIISTMKIENYKGSKQLIVVDNLLSNDSLARVKSAIYEKDSDCEELTSCFRKKAWYHINADDYLQAIEVLGNHMSDDGFINREIKDNVIERELISSTEIGNLVAIPHTIFTNDFPSVIGVGILDKTIRWNKEMVQLIFMICFSSKDKTSGSAFRYLYKIVKNINTVNHLIDSTNYNDFMEWLKGDRK